MKKTIIRLAIGAVLFVIAIMVPAEPYLLKLAVYLIAYLEIGYKVLWKAIRNISRGKGLAVEVLLVVDVDYTYNLVATAKGYLLNHLAHLAIADKSYFHN